MEPWSPHLQTAYKENLHCYIGHHPCQWKVTSATVDCNTGLSAKGTETEFYYRKRADHEKQWFHPLEWPGEIFLWKNSCQSRERGVDMRRHYLFVKQSEAERRWENEEKRRKGSKALIGNWKKLVAKRWIWCTFEMSTHLAQWVRKSTKTYWRAVIFKALH